MPSFNQEITADLNSDDSELSDSNRDNFNIEDIRPIPAEGAVEAPAPEGLSSDRQLAFTLRDFLVPTNTVSEVNEDQESPLSHLPYIDEQVDGAMRDSDDERLPSRDTEEVLNNAACRLRRWRAASQKLRRSRVIDNLFIEKNKDGVVVTSTKMDLADRLRSLAAAGRELLSLAPPPPAATAPPSPGCLLTPTLAEQSTAEYFGSSPECCTDTLGFDGPETSGTPAPPPGPRYTLVDEGALRICCFQHTSTVVDKILTAKFFRRWESHIFRLLEDKIQSATPIGLLENALFYEQMTQVYCVTRWDSAGKYCFNIVMDKGSLLLQAKDAYTRDQWYHSIIWKRNILRFRRTLSIKMATVNKDLVIRELKKMIDFAMTTPLQDDSVTRAPMDLLTKLLSWNTETESWPEWAERVTCAAAPLLAERCAGGELCAQMARLCASRPCAAPLPALAPPVRRVLTRNVDFAKAPHARKLVKHYISALSIQTSGTTLVRRFVQVTHGSRTVCPYPRAAPNLAAVALAAIDDHYRDKTAPHICDGCDLHVLCFADILEYMCEYEDWLLVVSGVLQPVPLSANAMLCPKLAMRLGNILRAILRDSRCSVHSCLVPARAARANPPSWFKVVAPSDPQVEIPNPEICYLWGDMLGSLLNCCSKRKSFLQSMSRQLPDFLLVAMMGHHAALEALCLMLEWEVASGEQSQLEIIATLQGTDLGQKYYKELCESQKNLQKLQAEGGPRRLALPVRATDADVAALLDAGALGNLECLSLAFTSVTSECARHLIKLPSLRYLNLWSTQFGDTGVQLIAEHLPKLQVLNLCETPVSDKGIEALSSLDNLRRLNLNSTKLSAEACQLLRQKLPYLQEFDIRYTEAW